VSTLGLEEALDGLTLEATFVAEVKRRMRAVMLSHFADIRECIVMINFENNDLSDGERKRLRKVYELVLEKIAATKTAEETIEV